MSQLVKAAVDLKTYNRHVNRGGQGGIHSGWDGAKAVILIDRDALAAYQTFACKVLPT